MAVTTAMRDQVSQLYVALFGRAPDAEGLGYWVGLMGQGQSFTQVANTMYGTSPARAYFPSYFSNADVISSFYTNVLGRPGDADGLAFWTNRLNATGATPGSVIADLIGVVANYSGSDTAGLASQALFNNRVAVAKAYAEANGNVANATAILSSVTSAPATRDAVLQSIANGTAAGVSSPGQTFVLTLGTDTVPGLIGSKGNTNIALNDTFDAASTTNSWTVFDKIDGGSGSDTLNVVTNQTAPPSGVSVVNVENITISTTGAGYTMNAADFTGLQSLVINSVTAGPVSITAASTATVSVSAVSTSDVEIIGSGGSLAITAGTGKVWVGQTEVANNLSAVAITGGGDGTGASTIAITDRSGKSAAVGSSLKAVTLTATRDDTLITANGLTTLTLDNIKGGASGVGDVTVVSALGTRELALNLKGVDPGAAGATAANTLAIADNAATSVKVVASSVSSSDITLAAGAATSVSLQADVALHLDSLSASSAATLSLAGAAAINLSALSLTSSAVITSTASAGVTIASELTAGQQFVGTTSSGSDSISLAAGVNKAITLGAGSDQVIYGGVLGTDGQVDGGTGEDTIVMSGAEADAADANSFFNARWKNFEVLSIESGANVTLDMQGLANLSKVATRGSTVVINNIAAGGTLQLTAASTSAVANVTAANFNENDSFNVALVGSSGAAFGTVSLPGVETVNISLADAPGAAGAANSSNSLTLQATAAKALNISGNHGLTITNTGNTAITSFSAAGVVANDGSDTAAGLAVTFYSANNTAGATVNITGGDGSDVLGGNSATLDVIQGGAGDDRIIGDVNAEVQSFTITTKANATGSMIVLVLGNAITVSGAADTDPLDTASRIVAAINADASVSGRVVASNANGASTTVTLTYAESLGNVASAGGVAALGGNSVVATPVAILTEGAVNSRADVLTGGAGNDTFLWAAGASNTLANLDTVTDLDLGTGSTTVDTLVFGNSGASRSVVVLSTAIQTGVSAAATLAGAAEVALTAITADGATGLFTYAGNTYVLHNGDGNGTFNPTADYLIKVTGVTGTLDIGDILLV
jgi:S-layer protein